MKVNLDERPRYTTGIVAEFLNIKPKTLINYENARLIITKRSTTGRRLFSKKDVFKLLLIRYFITVKHMRFAAIGIILSLLNEAERKGINLYQVIISEKKIEKYIEQVKQNL